MSALALMRPCKRSRTICKDRISQLPDGLIGHILSRLPTEDAVKTSVLSRTWRYNWTSVYKIYINDQMRNSTMPVFINYVTRLLVRSCNSRIKSFTLICKGKNYDPSYFETWLSCVLMRDVEMLKVSAWYVKRLHSWCFHNWTSLKELELRLSCTLLLPFNTLPNLERLALFGMADGGIKIKPCQIISEGRIVLTFPALVYILLKCEWLDVSVVEIHAPELITFVSRCIDEFKTYEIKIFAPKLQMFNLVNGSINNFDLHDSPVVSSAELDHPLGDETCIRRANKVLKQLLCVESLTLSSALIKALVAWKSGFGFPTFDRLKRLKLRCLSRTKDVVELLQLVPAVDMLHLSVMRWGNNDNDEIGEPWPPKIVSNLKTARVEHFDGHRVQLHFLKFIVENAKKLEQMTIIFCSIDAKKKKAVSDHLSKLLMPIKPPTCVLNIMPF